MTRYPLFTDDDELYGILRYGPHKRRIEDAMSCKGFFGYEFSDGRLRNHYRAMHAVDCDSHVIEGWLGVHLDNAACIIAIRPVACLFEEE